MGDTETEPKQFTPVPEWFENGLKEPSELYAQDLEAFLEESRGRFEQSDVPSQQTLTTSPGFKLGYVADIVLMNAGGAVPEEGLA